MYNTDNVYHRMSEDDLSRLRVGDTVKLNAYYANKHKLRSDWELMVWKVVYINRMYGDVEIKCPEQSNRTRRVHYRQLRPQMDKLFSSKFFLGKLGE